ncbi:dienelactone hydrolase family protein [Pseudonocardia sp. GCM10023141]|uniref:dienelactone hydrolase family protein n=1 Tax=Pseudonocardia sp. GCM10023141 TaxID=3252653 RepID=UPI00361E0C4A
MCHVHSLAGEVPAVTQREDLIPVRDGDMPVTLHLPPGGPGPGIVLLTDVYGRLPFYQGLAARLAGIGFVTVVPDYFFRQGALVEYTRGAAFARHSGLDEVGSVSDAGSAVAWTSRLDAVRGDRVGLLGFCLGGTIALDLAATGIDVAVACFYPFPRGFGNPSVAKAPRPVDLAADIRCPTLCQWGDADYIPLDDIEEFSAAMHAHGHPYTGHVYEGAGHGYLAGLTEERPDSAVARKSWDRTVEFLSVETDVNR